MNKITALIGMILLAFFSINAQTQNVTCGEITYKNPPYLEYENERIEGIDTSESLKSSIFDSYVLIDTY